MIDQKQFDNAAREAARDAMAALTPRQRVHFMLTEMLREEDAAASGALMFAAAQIKAHGEAINLREHQAERAL